jgi:hypothetical protein
MNKGRKYLINGVLERQTQGHPLSRTSRTGAVHCKQRMRRHPNSETNYFHEGWSENPCMAMVTCMNNDVDMEMLRAPVITKFSPFRLLFRQLQHGSHNFKISIVQK